MKGTNLGEFEELVLLIIANLQEEAYGLAIKKYVHEKCDRKVSLSTVHATLHRLESKGFLKSEYDNSSGSERGGRPKLIFILTSSGESTMRHTRELRNSLWETIPQIGMSKQ